MNFIIDNAALVIGLILALVIVIVIIYAGIKNEIKSMYGNGEYEWEINKHIKAARQVEPNNIRIISNKTTDEVVSDGITLMAKDKFNLLEGLNRDV